MVANNTRNDQPTGENITMLRPYKYAPFKNTVCHQDQNNFSPSE